MKVAFVSSEVYPFIKTGGLADVAYSLPKALQEIGHEVAVFLPKYRVLKQELLENIELATEVDVHGKRFYIECVKYDFVTYYLVHEPSLYQNDKIYESFNQDYEFAIFSDVVLKSLEHLGFQADVIHCNDWQTGLIPFFLTQRYSHQPFYKEMSSVYTIHNLRFQGQFSSHAIRSLGYEYLDEQINYMKTGILHAKAISTVSPTYAKEILTDFYGEGLNHVLQQRQNDLFGIVNGIDIKFFDPTQDAYLVSGYNDQSLSIKSVNKSGLQIRHGLEISEDVPLIGIVTRFDSQKGLDLIMEVIEEILYHKEAQIFILGSGEKKYEDYFQTLRDRYPSQLGVYFGYNEALAHLVYGASDLFLMPSLYEPCGLSQLISLRYGTIPVVRETGGLNDTVQSYREDTKEGNGFTFTNYNAHDMLYTIRRGISYYHQKDIWHELQVKGMRGDYSWDHSAQQYVDVYRHILANK
ncbi:MAG TPA: glycogen synthase [Firmicutes bacterium]|nr:glycogen synthase [Bacillota bacterium]